MDAWLKSVQKVVKFLKGYKTDACIITLGILAYAMTKGLVVPPWLLILLTVLTVIFLRAGIQKQ